MHGGVLRTYQLEFVFMTVVPGHRPFSATQPVMHYDLDFVATDIYRMN